MEKDENATDEVVNMLILNQKENPPTKISMVDQLLGLVPLSMVKETPLHVITKVDLANHFFVGRVVTVREMLRPQGVVWVTFEAGEHLDPAGDYPTVNRVSCPAKSLEGIVAQGQRCVITSIEHELVHVVQAQQT